MITTAAQLLNDEPSESEVEGVDNMWGKFNSTTQFLNALKQVMINRELVNELGALNLFLPVLAQVEANDMNAPTEPPAQPTTRR